MLSASEYNGSLPLKTALEEIQTSFSKERQDLKAKLSELDSQIIADKLRKLGIEVYKDKDLKIVIQNIVAISDLETELNLNEVAMGLGLENVEYEPEQFPGLVYRIRDPKVAMLLFGSGKIVCTGARQTEDVSKAVEKLSKELTSLDLIKK